jgi:hypothetical protein
MRTTPFTRPTIIAAVEFLGERHSQARFNQMALRLGLENEIPSRTDLSVSKKGRFTRPRGGAALNIWQSPVRVHDLPIMTRETPLD